MHIRTVVRRVGSVLDLERMEERRPALPKEATGRQLSARALSRLRDQGAGTRFT